ncbi:D-alanyl-D-alanine carboxypeptidase [Streptomyces sp. TG1A-60]|uniref:D-alanyl-D-alanine carboxypeptidase n=1 Tax=Streptomyces sp. TG1A-60 TaxID=3129111 RepID=UPI0030D15DEF
MAGTSPDRSKRYESSAGSTSGKTSAGSTSGTEAPTPEPGASGPLPAQQSPDPRLAISRGPSPKPDQATAVFSRKALLEGSEAEDLKPAETLPAATGPAATEPAEEPAVTEPAVTERDATKPAAPASAGSKSAESRSVGSKSAEPEADKAETAGKMSAGPEVDEPEADQVDAVGAGGADGSGSGGTGAEGTDGAGADATGPDVDAGHVEGSGKAADGSGGSEGSEGSVGDAEAQADEVGDRGVDAEPGAGAEAEGGDAHPRVRGDAAPAPTAPTASAARLPAVEAGKRAEADGDAEPRAAAQARGAGQVAADRPEDGAEPKGMTTPGSAVGTRPRPAGEAAADATHGVRSGAAGAGEPGSAGESGAGSASAGDEPEATDGADAPEGPPAADDGIRTGGAGGKSVGDGEAEAAGPVDHPTAVFRTPRAPAVDQPTTMLKLGGGDTDPADADAEVSQDGGPEKDKAAPEPPVERTSTFVALKSLDEAAPPKASASPAASDNPALSPAEATRAVPQVGPELTTQQPLPPRPPLDLLAELTNTPPPRQTPVRTIVRRVKIWTPLVVLLVIVFAVVQAVRPLPAPTLALTADASYAFEGEKASLAWPDEGQGWMDVNGIGTMDSFGEQKPVAIGSVAKAMTAYVILKEHPMKAGAKGETIPVDAKAETEGGYDKDGESTLNTLKEGDRLSQYDALAAIMIPSANNIARLLARWDGNGSEEAFVKKMNAAAKDLGMTDTTYTDPSGLKDSTVSTAEDQVKLGNALVKMKALTDITKLPYWHDPSGRRWDNYNRLVPYNNAIGIKTGSTTAAGGNLLFAATQEVGGETVIVVGAILGQHTPPIIDTVNAVSKTAMIAAQEALTASTILKKGDVVGYVDDQLGGRAPVVVTEDVSAVGWAGKTVRLELDASDSVPHEAKAGTKVGSLVVGDGSGDGVEVPVALQKDLTEPGFGAKLTRVS